MKWNLKEFFKNDNECMEFINSTEKNSIEFNQKYQNNLQNLTSSEFLEALKIYEKINENLAKFTTYAYLNFAIDTKSGSKLAKIEELYNKISENLLFFSIEFNLLDENLKQNFIENSSNYKYYLNLIVKQKSHELTFLEERILLRVSLVGSSAFARLFDETMSNLRFEFDDKLLKEEEILSLLHSKDREVRKTAALSLSNTLKQNSHLLSYIFNMIKTDLKITCDLKNYKFGEDVMHENNQIEKESVDSLIKVTQENFDLVSDFYNKKREILGYDELYDYDRYAPLGDDKYYSFEDCKEIILEAFNGFSKEFGDIAKTAFDENWIDVYPDDNKIGGAFSHSAVSSIHPFVLLNFTSKRRDLFTLAHELGHAIHQKLAYKVGFLNSNTPLTTAETASVFCEMLVFDYVYKKSDKKERLNLLSSKLEDIFATLYRQINFTTFEREIHSYKNELSSDEIGEIWYKHSKDMFGDCLILNDYYKFWWSYIPHFIHTPFYCYSYSYAQLLVLALFELYKSGKCENFVEIYTKFLSLGGSKSPRDMLAMFGLDIQSKEFWEIGIKMVRNLVSEFKELK
ncbi:M3 family oligoendopeptidase [Campylobacter sp. FMV-PI01]|uniref:M3 family oligoendopeptidase n=1 Tax=Campylobacter portucalensis TaxID=2608384 RepID=A0A6L5WHS5_9BACT|nr:M3 family oligoendopeptidase [Campylobacter portucalensis]MSN95787.1 M3 family oligoendopeptidase [Campylobacter portucalensis]